MKKKKGSGGGGDAGDTTAAASVSSAAAAASSSSSSASSLPPPPPKQKQLQQKQANCPRPLEACRALVLDAAHRPLGALPWTRAVSLYLSRDKRVEVLSFYEGVGVRSAYAEHPVPAVLRARVVVNVGSGGGGASAARRRIKQGRGFASSSSSSASSNSSSSLPSSSVSSGASSSSSSSSSTVSSSSLRPPAPSRRNVIARDNATCQYCGAKGPGRMTIDHIVPVSKGGGSSWTNLVASCSRCNIAKGSHTLEQLGWKLARPPRAPQRLELAVRSDLGGIPAEWKLWLPSPGGNKLERA